MRCKLEGKERAIRFVLGISLLMVAFAVGLSYGRAPPISPIRATAPQGRTSDKGCGGGNQGAQRFAET